MGIMRLSWKTVDGSRSEQPLRWLFDATLLLCSSTLALFMGCVSDDPWSTTPPPEVLLSPTITPTIQASPPQNEPGRSTLVAAGPFGTASNGVDDAGFVDSTKTASRPVRALPEIDSAVGFSSMESQGADFDLLPMGGSRLPAASESSAVVPATAEQDGLPISAEDLGKFLPMLQGLGQAGSPGEPPAGLPNLAGGDSPELGGANLPAGMSPSQLQGLLNQLSNGQGLETSLPGATTTGTAIGTPVNSAAPSAGGVDREPPRLVPQVISARDGRVELAVNPTPLPPDAVQSDGTNVTLSVRDTPLHTLLAAIAEQQGLSIVVPATLNSSITVSLRPMPLESALDAIMAISNCTWSRTNDVIYVTPIDKESPQNFMVQGRVMKVFNLNYIGAKDAESVITSLLSPIGVVVARESMLDNKLKSVEQVVVEDLPTYVARIADYIAQADQPPPQVMVELRILQVKLENDVRHGVDLEQMARAAGPEVWLKTQTFGNEENPGAVFTIGGSHFNQVLDLLASTLDSKTLASPRVLMVNGQESRIQIGTRLAFATSTTTQTTTVEAVQFLDVGTVLSVTPQISDQGQILMSINPKVSTGAIDPITQLPNEDTTEITTTILVPDGHGVIIGGLIQEEDIDRQSKVPWLGDLWLIGRLFQNRRVERQRTEVIVAMLPRVVGCHDGISGSDLQSLERVDLPLLTPELQSAPRPEPRLPDAVRHPKHLLRHTPSLR